MTRAVVFAYHDVGVRCLEVLRAAGVDVRLVATHEDDPHETVWFESVAARARLYGIPVVTPADPNGRETVERVRAAAPDLLFSFYYRRMLGAELLALPRRGAYNLHGSLLPKYRGRAPVNWAILHGERETGATLHEMVAKPDAGRIVDRERVPILPERHRPRGARESGPRRGDRARAFAAGARRRHRDASCPRTSPPAATSAGAVPRTARSTPPGPRNGSTISCAPWRRRIRVRSSTSAGAGCACCGLSIAACRPGRPINRLSSTADRALELRAADGGRLVVLEAELDGAPLDAARLRASVGPELSLGGDS